MSTRIPSNWLHLQNIFNLSQLVKHPTRVTKSSATLIDHVYTNQPNHVKSVAVRNCSISDHYPVCISYHRKFGKTKKQHHEYITYRAMKNFDENLFLEDLEKSPFDNIHAFDDPDESLLFFMNTFSDVLNKHAPLRIKRVKRAKQSEWMNDDIKTAMRNRDFYHRIKDDTNYKYWRNKTKYLIENAKYSYYKDFIEKQTGNAECSRKL